MNTSEALHMMLGMVAAKAETMDQHYSDSDYDVMENYLTVTAALLAADYEGDPSLLPTVEEAPWCPAPVIEFLRREVVE